MTQRDRLRDMDARITARFRAGGIADSVRYTPPLRGAAAVAATGLVNRSIEAMGFDSRLPTGVIGVTLFLGELSIRPSIGGRIEVLDALGAVTDTFTVTDIDGADESRVVCLCKEGA